MEQSSSWKANSSSASQEIPRILWNLNVYRHVQNSPPLVLVLSHTNPVHALPLHLFKMYFSIIFPFMPWSSEWPFSFRFPHQNCVCLSLLPYNCHMPHPPHPSWLNHLNSVVTSTDHDALYYAVFSILLLPCPSWAQISYLPQHSVVKHPQCERPCFTHIKHQTRL